VLFVPKAWFNRAAENTGQAAFWGISNWWLDRQVVNYFEPRAEMNPFTHTWSLGVEEQFYLIAPLLLFVALGHQFSAKRRFIGALGIAALALLSLVACYYFGLTRGARFVFYQMTFRFWELAAGVMLYLLGSRVDRLAGRALGFYRLSGWLGLLLVALALGLPKPTAYPWVRSTLAVLGTVLLIGLPGIERRDKLQPLLSSRPALWVGLRSYSLYLWHWPVYVLARWTTGLSVWPFNLVAVAVSFAAAAACYRSIENPCATAPRSSSGSRHHASRPSWSCSAWAGWRGARCRRTSRPWGLGTPRVRRPTGMATASSSRQRSKRTGSASRRCSTAPSVARPAVSPPSSPKAAGAGPARSSSSSAIPTPRPTCRCSSS
jgi:peptidoglycan/LPS O-acetylase OafA/YrhL